VLTGAEIPQDVRDADVGIRRFEMQRRAAPGNVRLIPEIDSAAGVAALPAMLRAVDRHSAVALNVDGLRTDLGLGGLSGLDGLNGANDPAGGPAIDHAMWEVALASRDAGLPWVVAAPAASAEERARLAARAREFGAAGACVASEAEIRGLNALFTPGAAAVEAARTTIAEWDDARSHGRPPRDRRALRRAQLLMAQVEAIERRERVR
ncbi:MAG: aldolase/citrate lyase family protein, partial [Dehalococcoidia bacterium]